jgi:hypothetical protein
VAPVDSLRTQLPFVWRLAWGLVRALCEDWDADEVVDLLDAALALAREETGQ